MSKYEVGYKAVIEVDKVFEQDGEKLYRAKGMKSLVFDGKGLDKLKPLSAYTETLKKEAEENYRMGVNAEYENWKEHLSRIRAVGQNEAWELARKIVLNDKDSYSGEELKEIFGYAYSQTLMKNYTYPKAAAKVAEWEKAKEKPQKTILHDFLEKFPNASKYKDNGLPVICPFRLGYCKAPSEDECSVTNCADCWNRPLEQIGGEEG